MSATSPGRVALITGAARGLARAVVVELAREGYRTAFTFRAGGTPPDETQAAARAAGGDAAAFPADPLHPVELANVVAAVADALGPVEIFVHAIGPIIVKRFTNSTLEDYRAMVDGNLGSAVAGAVAVLPAMRAAGFGRLVFFGMNGSHATLPARGMSLYGAAKAGVVSFARTLALEEATRGITVNIIEPGDIRDKEVDRAGARLIAANNPTGHAGSSQDVAFAVRFLVSDDASFINGMTIGVNGGRVEPYE